MVGIVFYQKENKRWERRWGSVREHAGLSSPWGCPAGEQPRWHITAPRGDKCPCQCSHSVVTKGSSELVSPMRS